MLSLSISPPFFCGIPVAAALAAGFGAGVLVDCLAAGVLADGFAAGAAWVADDEVEGAAP